MSQQHEKVVERQFGERASAYLHSTVHAQGEEFDRLRSLLAGHANARVLDLGCGAGHVSFQVAALAGEVLAYDLSADMLAVVASAAEERGIGNIVVGQGVAEHLPFADASFDFVFSRFSAHHWSDVGLALREARRVLKPGGKLAIVDLMAPGQPLFDTFLQTVELLRDTSHVRNYSVTEWHQYLAEAGLRVDGLVRQRLRLEFASWVERMRTPVLLRQAIRHVQVSVGQEVRDYFEIAGDGSFSTDVLVFWASR